MVIRESDGIIDCQTHKTTLDYVPCQKPPEDPVHIAAIALIVP
jgi:hypothetical protein